MAAPFNIKVVRYPAMLKGNITLQPELQEAIDTIDTRLSRPGKGLGERRNVMHTQRQALGARYAYEVRHSPRRSGSAKRKKMTGIFKGMTPNVMKKMFQRIANRWEQSAAA